MTTEFSNHVANTVMAMRLEIESLKTNIHSLTVQNANALKKNVPENLEGVIIALNSNVGAIEHQANQLLAKIPAPEIAKSDLAPEIKTTVAKK